MARKRKPEDGAALEEHGKAVFQKFTAAANCISQLYAETEEQKKAIFRAGELHGLEKVRQWIISKQGDGFPVTREDVLIYLQDELEYTTGDSLGYPASQSTQAQSGEMQMLTQSSYIQNQQMSQGSKHTKTPGGFLSENNLLMPQIVANEVTAGNYFPRAFAQLERLTEEDDLSETLDSEMDMNIDEHS